MNKYWKTTLWVTEQMQDHTTDARASRVNVVIIKEKDFLFIPSRQISLPLIVVMEDKLPGRTGGASYLPLLVQ